MNFTSFFKSNNFFYILIFFLPFSFFIGPAFLNTTVSLICFIFLIIYFFKNINIAISKIILILYIIWIFYLILRSILSENIILSLEASLLYFRYGVFFLSVLFLFQDTTQSKKFYICLLSSLLILCFDGIYQFFNGENLIGLKSHNSRVSSFFGEEFILGHHLSKILPLIIGLTIFFFSKKTYKNIIIFLILIVASFTILFSGDRSALIFLFLTILLTLYYFYYSSKKSLYFSIFVIISIFATVISYSENVKNRIINNSITEIYSKDEFRFYSHQHELHFKSAFKMFIQNPTFGIGPKLFRHHCSDKKYNVKEKINKENEHFLIGCSTSPHNLTIQLLAEVGIFGTVPVLILILALFYKFFHIIIINNQNKKFYLIFIYLSCLICLSPFTPTGNIFGSYISTMIYLNLSIAYYLDTKKNEKY